MLGLLKDTMELIVNAASAGGIYADVRNEANVRRSPLYGLRQRLQVFVLHGCKSLMPSNFEIPRSAPRKFHEPQLRR
jgi:hypothetical protein